MTEIVLKPELLKGLQKVLVDYEPKNEAKFAKLTLDKMLEVS